MTATLLDHPLADSAAEWATWHFPISTIAIKTTIALSGGIVLAWVDGPVTGTIVTTITSVITASIGIWYAWQVAQIKRKELARRAVHREKMDRLELREKQTHVDEEEFALKIRKSKGSMTREEIDAARTWFESAFAKKDSATYIAPIQPEKKETEVE